MANKAYVKERYRYLGASIWVKIPIRDCLQASERGEWTESDEK